MTDGDTVYTVNTSTGLATSVASLGIYVNDSNMSTTHPQTGQVYLGDSDNESLFLLYTLDSSTGDMTLLGTHDNDLMSAIEFSGDVEVIPSTPVPTLAGWSLLLLTLWLGIIGMRRLSSRTA